MQNLICILRILFNNDTLTPRDEKIRTQKTSKQNGPLEFSVRPGCSQCLHMENVRESLFKIHVQCSNQYSKYQNTSSTQVTVFKTKRQSLTLYQSGALFQCSIWRNRIWQKFWLTRKKKIPPFDISFPPLWHPHPF